MYMTRDFTMLEGLILSEEDYIDSPKQRVGARVFQFSIWESSSLRIATKPRSGPFYFIPRPLEDKFEWQLVPFFEIPGDSKLDYRPHDLLWRECLELLAGWWGKDLNYLKQDLGRAHAAFPRGRIIPIGDIYKFVYGGDITKKMIQKVLDVYGLNQVNVRYEIDKFEKMSQDHIDKALKIFQLSVDLKGLSNEDILSSKNEEDGK